MMLRTLAAVTAIFLAPSVALPGSGPDPQARGGQDSVSGFEDFKTSPSPYYRGSPDAPGYVGGSAEARAAREERLEEDLRIALDMIERICAESPALCEE